MVPRILEGDRLATRDPLAVADEVVGASLTEQLWIDGDRAREAIGVEEDSLHRTLTSVSHRHLEHRVERGDLISSVCLSNVDA